MKITVRDYSKEGTFGEYIRFTVNLLNEGGAFGSFTVECSIQVKSKWKIENEDKLFFSLYPLIKSEIISMFNRGMASDVSGLLPLQYNIYNSPETPVESDISLPDVIEVELVATREIAIDGSTSKEKCEDLLEWTSEDDKLEWKSFGVPQSAIERAALAKAIIAMSNTKGGYIILGKDDNGSICGITQTTIDPNIVLQKVNPLIMPKIKQVRTAVHEKDGHKIGMIYIPLSDELPHITIKECEDLKKNVLYIRKSGSSDFADYTDYQRIFNEVFKRKISEMVKEFERSPIMKEIKEIKNLIALLFRELIKKKERKKEISILEKFSPKELSLIEDEDFVNELERRYRKNDRKKS